MPDRNHDRPARIEQKELLDIRGPQEEQTGSVSAAQESITHEMPAEEHEGAGKTLVDILLPRPEIKTEREVPLVKQQRARPAAGPRPEQEDILDDPATIKTLVESILAAENAPGQKWPDGQIEDLIIQIRKAGLRYLDRLEVDHVREGKQFYIKAESAPDTPFDKLYFQPRIKLQDLLAQRTKRE